jgi:hypothetical protein
MTVLLALRSSSPGLGSLHKSAYTRPTVSAETVGGGPTRSAWSPSATLSLCSSLENVWRGVLREPLSEQQFAVCARPLVSSRTAWPDMLNSAIDVNPTLPWEVRRG